jgi:hypothetical protein
MRSRYLVLSLAFLLVGCAQPSRSRRLKAGATYVTSSGALVEVGVDGKAHKVELPLDQVPLGSVMSPTH